MTKKIFLLITIVIGMMFLAGCDVQETPDEDDTIDVCTEVYDPVCGADNVTYSNSCFADKAGVEVEYEGECKSQDELILDSIEEYMADEEPGAHSFSLGDVEAMHCPGCFRATARYEVGERSDTEVFVINDWNVDHREPVANKNDLRTECEYYNGDWLEEYKECVGISEEDCEKMDGEFNACASACRNDPDAEVCTMQCVMVCSFT